MPARAGSCHGAVSAAKTRAAMLLQRDIYSNWVGRFLGRSSRRLRAVEEAGYTGDKQRRARVDRCHAIETGYSTRVGRPHEEQQAAQLDGGNTFAIFPWPVPLPLLDLFHCLSLTPSTAFL